MKVYESWDSGNWGGGRGKGSIPYEFSVFQYDA